MRLYNINIHYVVEIGINIHMVKSLMYTPVRHDHAQGIMDTQTSSIGLHKYCINTDTQPFIIVRCHGVGSGAIRLFREPVLVSKVSTAKQQLLLTKAGVSV